MPQRCRPVFTTLIVTLGFWASSLTAASGAADRDGLDIVSAIKSLKWRSIGPANMGGRVTDIVGIPGDAKVYYLAGADGGVFKTTNGGVTFEALFEDQRAFSVGALAIAASDPEVIWLGSGEGDPRNSVGYGNGVYRSVDGGRTWTHLGLDDTERIKRIVVDPRDPDSALVCALGHEWGPNEERGVFKTVDGGQTWKKVLYFDEDTGCSDIAMENRNPRVLYAGMWTFRRRPWRFDDGGGETALHRSMDGGETWKKLSKGLPKGDLARIGVSIAQNNPRVVYMITESVSEGTLFRSEDRGDSWEMVSDARNINFRPFYYSDIRVDPNNADHIYSLSGGLFKSTDGGHKFERIGRGVHGDHQALWIDPEDSRRVLSGSDGGFQVSWDAGRTWDIVNNVVLSQFYQLNLDDRDPYYVCGGLQDNGTWCGPSRTTHNAGILKADWYKLTGGDGYYAVPVPGNPHQVYTNLQGGVIFFTDLKKNLTRTIHPYPNIIGSAGDAIENHKYRFNWDSPIHISPHDPNIVYFGGNVLFKTTDQGYSWKEISPDLTTNDKEKQRTSGGSIYQDNTAAEFHCTILTIAESPLEAGVIWIGTDDGNVQVTRNGGKSWTHVSGNVPDLPAFSWIAKIEASSHSKGTAYVAVDNHRSDLFRPYAYKTTDYGQTWTAIHEGLPSDDYVKVVREDPRNSELLYAGMEHGIYASWDGGLSWASIRTNLPPVSVRDLRVHPREHDLVVATHGRGIWILDDARPLQDLPSAMDDEASLFPIRATTRRQFRNRTANLGDRIYAARNPENGAIISFYLKHPPVPTDTESEGTNGSDIDSTENHQDEITLAIFDSDGDQIRELESLEVSAGINRVVWDLRFKGIGERSGPRVAPGDYKAVLGAGGAEFSRPIRIKADPRLGLATDDYEAQVDAALELLGLQEDVERLLERVDLVLSQFASLSKSISKVSSDDDAKSAFGKEFNAKDVIARIGEGRQAFEGLRDDGLKRPLDRLGYRQRPRLREELRSLMRAIDESAGRPTAPQLARIDDLAKETRDAKKTYDRLRSLHVDAINRLLKDLPAIFSPES